MYPKTLLQNQRLIRYLFIACVIVGCELVLFQGIYLTTNSYLAATVGSFLGGVVLNWIASRKFVFGASHHAPMKEFTLVLGASVVGLGIQVSIVYMTVELLALYPLIGKIISICFSFFWNYWFRARFIFVKKTAN